MRSFAVPALIALVGCGDNLPPEEDDVGAVVTEDEHEEETPPTPARIIDGFVSVYFPSCDENVAEFEVVASYLDDGTPVPGYSCEVRFDDGAVSNACLGRHTFATGGTHTFVVEVTDPATGATATFDHTRIFPDILTMDLDLAVPECGLAFDYAVNLSTGAELHVWMQEADAFVNAQDTSPTGTFTALRPGTYNLRASAEDERGAGPICLVSAERTVTLAACPDHPDEPHGEDCGH